MVMAGVCLCLEVCERFSGREHWGGVGEMFVLATGVAREVFVLGGYIYNENCVRAICISKQTKGHRHKL